MTVFARLGRDVEQAWRRENRDLAALPAIAARALRALSATAFDEMAVARRAVVDPDLPAQLPVPFGDAQVTVWRGSDVLVQLVYWLDGTTAIHQHGFAGAFRVVRGTSMHSTHVFESRRVIDPRFQLGTLVRTRFEVLRAGSVREIGAGSSLIHNLIHLTFPSVTLVVRTPFLPLLSPQWSYHPPGVAVDPNDTDANRRARGRLFVVCMRVDPQKAQSVAASIIASGLAASWDLLDTVVAEAGDAAAEPYLAMIRRRHGVDGRLVADAFARSRVRVRLFRLREQFRGPPRVLLAMLADGGDRATILDTLRDLGAGDPLASIEGWLRELAPALGMTLDRPSARVLRGLIEGTPPAEIAVRGYSGRDVADLARAFRASPLFAPLLAEPSARRGPVTRTSKPRSSRAARRPASSARRR